MTFQLQPKHTAPAITSGIGFIHRLELFGPERVEGAEAMTLKQRAVFSSQKNQSFASLEKNLTTCRIRFLSAVLSRVHWRYCM